MFSANRLKVARKRRKLTHKALAERIDVTPLTISRLEKGSTMPEQDTLEALIKELAFPKDFFFGDDLDEPTVESASFRSLTSMTARERDAALSAGALAYLLNDWVEANFDLPNANLIDLGYETDSENAARSLRQHWGLGEKPIGNMIKLFESKGIRVFSLSENTENVDAFSCWRNSTPFVFLNNFKTPERSRFDAAHELGHLVLHRHGAPKGRKTEIEANQFASSFLMPTMDVISTIPRCASVARLVTAKRRWGVSLAALAYRLNKMGILSDWNYRTICIQINRNGKDKEENGIGRDESEVWKKVFHTLWRERITKNHVANDLQIPFSELENLVFGLVMPPKPSDGKERSPGSQSLRAV